MLVSDPVGRAGVSQGGEIAGGVALVLEGEGNRWENEPSKEPCSIGPLAGICSNQEIATRPQIDQPH